MRYLIIGGTGSFGNAMVDHLLKKNDPNTFITILSRDEKKQEDMARKYEGYRVSYVLADIRDVNSISLSRSIESADRIFCAAALKQVPSCENNVDEAIKTNVMGTMNVIETVKFIGKRTPTVMLSTDKAVEPINTMGITKALMERMALSDAYGSCINVTRYGNVSCSRGSAIPKFIEAIKKGGSITLYHKDMTRFMMRMDDAISLVMTALEYKQGGNVFLLKPKSVYIYDLVMALYTMLGKEPHIYVTNPRKGEKLHESLVNQNEKVYDICGEDTYIIPYSNSISARISTLYTFPEVNNALFRSNDVSNLLSSEAAIIAWLENDPNVMELING